MLCCQCRKFQCVQGYLELWGSSELRTQDLMENCSRKSFNLHVHDRERKRNSFKPYCPQSTVVHANPNAHVNDLLVTSINIIHKQQGLPCDQSEIETYTGQGYNSISLMNLKLTSVWVRYISTETCLHCCTWTMNGKIRQKATINLLILTWYGTGSAERLQVNQTLPISEQPAKKWQSNQTHSLSPSDSQGCGALASWATGHPMRQMNTHSLFFNTEVPTSLFGTYFWEGGWHEKCLVYQRKIAEGRPNSSFITTCIALC